MIDRAILNQLQVDGRITNAELATRVGLSPSACFRRVRNLEDRGVINEYTAVIDQAACGHPQNVFVEVSLKSQEGHDLEEFEAQVASIPEVMECYLMSGDFDYLIRVIVKDTADYERLHRHFLTRLPGIDRVRSSFSLRTVEKKMVMPFGD